MHVLVGKVGNLYVLIYYELPRTVSYSLLRIELCIDIVITGKGLISAQCLPHYRRLDSTNGTVYIREIELYRLYHLH